MGKVRVPYPVDVPDERPSPEEHLATDITASSVGALIGLVGGPVGAVAGAATAPLLRKGLIVLRNRVLDRRDEKAAFVIETAAREAGIEPDELAERLQSTPDRAELFLRVVRAAEDAGHVDRLVAIAQSLAAAATSNDDLRLHWEKAFVRAIGELDAPHIELLRRFTMTFNENNLRAGEPESDKPTVKMSEPQIALALPGWDEILPALLAALDGHGLVSALPGGGGYGPGPRTWAITTFGRAVVERLDVVREVLDHQPNSDA